MAGHPSHLAPAAMRSSDRICRSSVDVKTWQSKMPSVSSLRPGRCAGCGAAGQPAGSKLVLHGDGTRERQVRGAETPGGRPVITTVLVRRYECQKCGTCMLVVPSSVLPRRLFSACAIGLALALWGLLGHTEAAVRARVSPLPIVGATASAGWVTLRRWSAESARGRLLSTSRTPPLGFTLRQHAERAAAGLEALAPAGLSREEAAFFGGGLHR